MTKPANSGSEASDASFRHLDYQLDTFGPAARKLIAAGVPFTFHVVGRAREQLVQFIQEGRIADPARLGLYPKLQLVLGVLILAEGAGRSISIQEEEDHVRFSVGSALA